MEKIEEQKMFLEEKYSSTQVRCGAVRVVCVLGVSAARVTRFSGVVLPWAGRGRCECAQAEGVET
jgi:hypothetical protein